MWPSIDLVNQDLFKLPTESLSTASRAELSYLRAKAIGVVYGLNIEDILKPTPAFWKLHTDPILTRDGAATTLLTIQYNLVLGTLATFIPQRRDLSQLAEDLLTFKMLGQFCLTELGRGLDILNMKTTATLLDSGDFDLHTPTPQDAKFMPPTVPVLGIPCIGLVFARLIVKGAYRGNRAFIVNLNDGYHMCPGVSAKLLPSRGGSNPVNHSLTSFNHVRLPGKALLGSLESPLSVHSHFMASIWRVNIGTLGLAATSICQMQLFCYIVARYSQRRQVTSPYSGKPVPIISFPTQKLPLMCAIANSYVFNAFYQKAVNLFMDKSLDPRLRRGVAATFKAVLIMHAQNANLALSDRCGAQGLFGYNQMSTIFNEERGIAIAEGDILGLSIRFIADLLAAKYEVPPHTAPSSLLAKHETALLRESFHKMQRNNDPMEAFRKHVSPHCQKITEAIGHRLAYEAAIEAEVDPDLTNLYVCSAIRTNPLWFFETGVINRFQLEEMEEAAVLAMEPKLEGLLQAMGVEQFVSAPVVSDKKWSDFEDSLQSFGKSSPISQMSLALPRL